MPQRGNGPIDHDPFAIPEEFDAVSFMRESATAKAADTDTDIYPTRLPGREARAARVDPVVWRRRSEDRTLTKEQTERFRRDGFLVLTGLFETAEMRALIEDGLALRDRAGELPADEVITEPGLGPQDGPDAVRTVFRLDAHSALMRRLAEDRRLAGVARFLLGDEVYVHQSRLNYKPGFTGRDFYWHSDFETWHAEDGMPRMRALSASLLLTDNNALNGPLMLMPGSHRTFVGCKGATPDDNFRTSLKKQEIGVPSHDALTKLAAEYGIEAATGPAGTLVLFDCNVMHGSNGNITPNPRSNAFFVFNAVSNRLAAPFAALKPRPDFLARRKPVRPIEISCGPIS